MFAERVRKKTLETLKEVGNDALLILGSRPATCRPRSSHVRRPSAALRVHVHRHSAPKGAELVFALLNIRSVANKLDDLLDVRRDLAIDVLFLVETWHAARR